MRSQCLLERSCTCSLEVNKVTCCLSALSHCQEVEDWKLISLHLGQTHETWPAKPVSQISAAQRSDTVDTEYVMKCVVVPGVGVGDVEPLAEQFVRMPLQRFSGQFPKHLHLDGSLFVVHVALTTKQPTTATHIYRLSVNTASASLLPSSSSSSVPQLYCIFTVSIYYFTAWPPTSWSRLTSTVSSSSWCLARVKREDSEEELGLYRMEARTNSSLSLLRSHSVIPGSRLCSRASEGDEEEFLHWIILTQQLTCVNVFKLT